MSSFPQLSLKTTRDREIYIAGEVKTPGVIEYQDELTVLDALLRSGGPTKETADIENIILIRTQADGERLGVITEFVVGQSPD